MINPAQTQNPMQPQPVGLQALQPPTATPQAQPNKQVTPDFNQSGMLSPADIAGEYGGDKQKIAMAMQQGILDPTQGVLAGMFIDRMSNANIQAPPTTVAQRVMQPQQNPSPAAASSSHGQMPTRTAAGGGLMGLPVPQNTFSYSGGGGVVAFADSGSVGPAWNATQLRPKWNGAPRVYQSEEDQLAMGDKNERILREQELVERQKEALEEEKRSKLEAEQRSGGSLLQRMGRFSDETGLTDAYNMAAGYPEYILNNTINGIEQQPKDLLNLDGKMSEDLAYILEGRLKDSQGNIHDFRHGDNPLPHVPSATGPFVEEYRKGVDTAMNEYGLGETTGNVVDWLSDPETYKRESGGKGKELTPEEEIKELLAKKRAAEQGKTPVQAKPGLDTSTTGRDFQAARNAEKGLGQLTTPTTSAPVSQPTSVEDILAQYDKYGIDKDAQRAALQKDKKDFMLGRGMLGVGASMLATQRPGSGNGLRDIAGAFGEGVTSQLPSFDKQIEATKARQQKAEDLRVKQVGSALGITEKAKEGKLNRDATLEATKLQMNTPDRRAFEGYLAQFNGDAGKAYKALKSDEAEVYLSKQGITAQGRNRKLLMDKYIEVALELKKQAMSGQLGSLYTKATDSEKIRMIKELTEKQVREAAHMANIPLGGTSLAMGQSSTPVFTKENESRLAHLTANR